MQSTQKKPTLTVGIPAHNEEANIANLVRSILLQEGNFTLERIIVVCDGCTDRTAEIVCAFGSPYIDVRDDGKRRGKAARLNELYALNQSDLLVTLDGDVLVATSKEFERMASVFRSDPDTLLVAGRIEPFQPRHKGFIARALHTNYLLWNTIVNPLNGGDHIHNSQGPAMMLRNDFAALCKYPEHITCDEGFAYLTAKERNGFRFAHDTLFFTTVLETLADVKIGVPRYIHERYDLVPYFGADVLQRYEVPIAAKVRGILHFLTRHPLSTLGALAYNVWMKYAFTPQHVPSSGVWERIGSTKHETNSP